MASENTDFAILHFRRAIDLNPDYETTRKALKMAQGGKR
jgi:hypothetical protein